jgi:predicted glutamine amidotransferase
MCRLLGWVSDQPTTLAALLGPARLAAFSQLSRLYAVGWGLAWLDDDGGIQRVREPRAAHDSAGYRRAVSEVRTRAAILHLRGATIGLPASVENTHPFVAGGRAFAHNGVIMPFQGMYELLTDEERARLEGETDSEQYFALLSASIADRGRVAGVRDAVHRIGRDQDVTSLNAMMLTPDELTVISSHDPAAGPSPGPNTVDQHGHFELLIETGSHATVVASSAWGQHGWVTLPNGVVLSLAIDGRAVQSHRIEHLDRTERGLVLSDGA